MKWAPIQECKKLARTRRGFYKCAGCEEEVPASTKIEGSRRRTNNVHVDHIKPIIDPAVGWTTWDDCIENMFSELDNLQLLCTACHKAVTDEEKAIAKDRRGFYKTHPNEYPCYTSMKGRCNNPNKSDYHYYGGRGIKVCPEWEDSFLSFVEDMGPRPEGTSIDRIDVDKDYSKENCRWATHKQQCNNTRANTYIEYEGVTRTLSEWCDFTGVSRGNLSHRIKNQWTVGEALEVDPSPSRREITERLKQKQKLEKLNAESE
tara:strand:+ start:17774 stop:18556 length:783 start_codon:yes stop_codon:yes gene_type:complete